VTQRPQPNNSPVPDDSSEAISEKSLREMKRAWILALVAISLTCIPYLFGLAVAYPDRFFVGNAHLPDDSYVYLSWMRQAHDGRITFYDAFTTQPQAGGFFNLLFLALGIASRLSHLPLLVVFHLARVGFGLAFLIKSYGLLRRLFQDSRYREAAYLFLCFSAGLGWAFSRVMMASPVDLWQAESNTFLSLYMNPLFAAALWLMAFIFERLRAFERSGKIMRAVEAGGLGVLLANIHSYDILIVWAVSLATFCAQAIYLRQRSLNRALAALLIVALPLPAVWQQWRFYQTNPLFHARALVPTLSPAIYWYLLGLGLLVPLGAYGAYQMWRRESENRSAALFLILWAILGLAIPYVPLSFQRKLAMGIHIPWAFLSGVGLVELLQFIKERGRRYAYYAVVFFASLTPLRWFYVAIQNISNNTCEAEARILLNSDEMQAIHWLSKNANHNGALAAPLQLGGVAGYLPALAGTPTYAGHWGETPDFSDKLRETIRFYSSETSDEQRRIFLRRANIRYVFWSDSERNAARLLRDGSHTPADLSQMAGLRVAFQSGGGANRVTILQVE
jgi:arabinosyltransferase C